MLCYLDQALEMHQAVQPVSAECDNATAFISKMMV